MRLDEVTVFGGKLSFFIPHDWEQEDEDGDLLYHPPNADSGWFRVSLITVKSVDGTAAERLKRGFEDKGNVTQNEETGNWISTRQKDSEEAGVKIRIYYWFVGNVVGPDLMRRAIFSYTVLLDRASDDETKEMLDLLGQIAGLANFNRESGEP